VTAWAVAPWVEAIGRGLVRSTWQGVGIALALWLALRVLRRSSPQGRYLAAGLALASMVALPVLTGGPEPGRPEARPAVRADLPAAAPGREMAAGPTGPRPGVAGRLESALPLAVAAWLAGVGVLSARLAGGLVVAARRRRRGTRPPADAWAERLGRIGAGLGVRRAVLLLESSYLEVPTVIGWLRPAILVPASAWLGLSTAELEAILAHELAHIRRHDYLFNLFGCVAETLLFYHPCARWASRVIRQEREHCCDDLAVAATGDRLTYARALAAMEGLRGPGLSLSPAANGGSLLARVGRLLEPQAKEEDPMRPLMTLGILAALALAPIGLARVAAQQPDPAPAPLTAAPGQPTARPDTDRDPRSGAPINDRNDVGPDRQEPFPNRSYADIVANVDEAPTGRLMFGAGAGSFGSRLRLGGAGSPKAVFDADNVVISIPAGSIKVVDDGEVGLDPPTEAEVLDRLQQVGFNAPKTPIGCRKILIERIGSKLDPAKAFPLAGPCHLVHINYQATIEYDEKVRSVGPNPVEWTRPRVIRVLIDKDHLRRPKDNHLDPVPAHEAAAELDRKLDELSRKIEALKRDYRRDRQIREEDLDRLRRDLDDLERRGAADPKKSAAVPAPDPSRAFIFAVGSLW